MHWIGIAAKIDAVVLEVLYSVQGKETRKSPDQGGNKVIYKLQL